MTSPGLGATSFPRPFGKYTLLRHLAIGGMADVFLAQQQGPAGFEKECVIKRILPHLAVDHDFVQMFLDEARIAARLSHPNIVQLFDLGQEGGDYYLAMEYVDGVNLEQLAETVKKAGKGAVRHPIAARILSDIAAGLDHAHNSRDSAGRPLGLVHRDVSPSNIMISWSGASKILDFGIAKAAASNIKRARTEVGTVKGKIPYMSPEQLQGFPLDGRSDVFSLGVILYEVTCGCRPFPGENAGQLTVQIINDQPLPPEQHQPGYPAKLREIVLRALAKRPEDRFQSARDMKVALEGYLAAAHAAITVYDVEAYVRELFTPASAKPRQMLSGHEATEASQPAMRPYGGGRVATAVEDDMQGDDGTIQQREVTGIHDGPQGNLAELAQNIDVDLEQQEESMRRRRGSGSATMLIVGLVVVTLVVLFFVRDYIIKKDPPKAGDNAATAADLLMAPPQAAADAGAAKAAVPETPQEKPKPKVEEPVQPKPPVPKAPDVVKPAAKPPVKPPERPAAKPKPPKGDGGDKPVQLPRLSPPPDE